MDQHDVAAQYRSAYPKLLLIASGLVGNRSDAHDLVQEAFVIALEKSAQFKPGSSYPAWLSGIVRNCALNFRRKTYGRKTSTADPDLLAQLQDGGYNTNSTWPIRMDTGELVESQAEFDDNTLRALKQLKPEARCCLLLRVLMNLSYAEISELMSIPAGTAMSYVHRSKQQIRESLAADANPLSDKKTEP